MAAMLAADNSDRCRGLWRRRAILSDDSATQKRFETVSDLVDGFESPFRLELLSAGHWTAEHETGTHDLEQVKVGTYSWSERTNQFSPRQIELALTVLVAKGWLTSVGHH